MAEPTDRPHPDSGASLTPVHMPSLGADMDAGTVLEWLVQPGSEVHRGDVLAVVQTDKSDLDVEVFHDGTVAELTVPVGEKVPVGTVIAMLAPLGAAVAPFVASPGGAPVEGRLHSPVLRRLADTLHVDVADLPGSGAGGRITRTDIEQAAARPRITPRARRLARDRGIDPHSLGGHGVVTGEHVLAAVPSRPVPQRGPDREAMRRSIARQMTSSWQQIPHYRVAMRVDVERAMAALDARNLQRPAAERLLPAALLAHAAARAAAEVPAVNGHWVEGRFVPGVGVQLGVVVSLRSGGLLVPVVRDADRLGPAEMMDALRDLVGRARGGRLRASEVGAATFTVTDLGEGGADSVSPIIHPPQVAIVGFGAVRPEAVVVEGAVAARRVVHVSLAGDHRAIDGRVGSSFLTTLSRTVQEVSLP